MAYVWSSFYNGATGKFQREKVYVSDKKKRKNARNRKAQMNPELREAILKRDKRRCVKCGCKKWLHVHHIVPRSKGGSNDHDNLVTLCDICHMEEHRGETVYNIMIKKLFIYEKAN